MACQIRNRLLRSLLVSTNIYQDIPGVAGARQRWQESGKDNQSPSEPAKEARDHQDPSESARVRQSPLESVRSPSEVRQSPPALAGTQQDRKVAVSVGKWQSGRSSDSQCKQNPSSPVVRAWQLSLEFIRVCQSLLGPIKARERMASASQRLSGPIRAHQSSPRLVRAYQDSPRLGRASPRPVGARQR